MRKSTVFILIGLVVLVSGTWWSAVNHTVDWLKVEDLAPLFTGLGFVGIVVAFLQERAVVASTVKEHGELIQAMLVQTTKTAAMVNAAAKNTRVLGLAAELRIRESQIVNKDPSEDTAALVARRTALLEELVRIL